MKLRDFLHRTCVIIPLSNGVMVCGARGPRARCAGYFQHIVLYTIVKYSIQYGWKNLNRGYIVGFEHSSGFRQQKFMLICKSLLEWCFKICYVCKCVCHFNDGRESIENDPRVGRPVSVLTKKNVATMKTLI